jgi:hypothetical protein
MKKNTRSTRIRSSAKRISEDGAERTIQHLSLPPAVVGGMRQLSTQRNRRKGAIWDAACEAFAEKFATKPFQQYVAASRAAAPTTVWIDSRVLQKCRKIAERDGVSLSRVLHTAAILYLEPTR